MSDSASSRLAMNARPLPAELKVEPHNLLWQCGHCLSLNDFVYDGYCTCCHRRRDSYAIITKGDPVDRTVYQSHEWLSPDGEPLGPVSKDILEDVFTKIDVDKPSESSVHQTYSIGPSSKFEDYLYSENDPGGQDWVASSLIRFCEGKGLSSFSLETGEPAKAPRKRAYSPGERSKVADVRRKGACPVCRRKKRAVS